MDPAQNPGEPNAQINADPFGSGSGSRTLGLQSVADPDPGFGAFLTPGSGMEKIRIRDVYNGSVTLGLQIFFDRLLLV
jgi:hypothetical protein